MLTLPRLDMPYRPPEPPLPDRPRVVSERYGITVEPTMTLSMSPELCAVRAQTLAAALCRVYGPDTFAVESSEPT